MRRPYGCIYLSELPLALDIVRATHASPLRLYISIRITLGLGHCTGDACVAPTAVYIYPNCPWPWTLYGRRMRRPYGCIYLSELPLALDIVRATHASPLRLYISIRIALGLGRCTGDACVAPTAVYIYPNCPWPWTLYGRRMRRPYGCIYLSELPLALDIVRATHASPLRLYISIRIAFGLGHCTGDACVAPTAVYIYPNCPWPWTLYGRRMRRPYGFIYLSELPLALDIVGATHASPLRLYISIRIALSLDIVRATHASPLRLYISIRIALGLGHCRGDACVAPTAVYIYPNCPEPGHCTGDACVAPTAVYIYPNCPWPWTL